MQLKAHKKHVHKQGDIDTVKIKYNACKGIRSNDALKALSYPQGLKQKLCITASDPRECLKGLLLWMHKPAG